MQHFGKVNKEDRDLSRRGLECYAKKFDIYPKMDWEYMDFKVESHMLTKKIRRKKNLEKWLWRDKIFLKLFIGGRRVFISVIGLLANSKLFTKSNVSWFVNLSKFSFYCYRWNTCSLNGLTYSGLKLGNTSIHINPLLGLGVSKFYACSFSSWGCCNKIPVFKTSVYSIETFSSAKADLHNKVDVAKQTWKSNFHPLIPS